MPEIYRVGTHQPQNLYRGDTYIGVMFDPADAALIVQVLNGETSATYPPIRDANGDLWEWDEAAGGYSLTGVGGGMGWTARKIEEIYGLWAEPTDAG